MSIPALILLTVSMYKLNINEFKAVLAVESSTCINKVNPASTARGCGQILKGTSMHYKFDHNLMHDNTYSIIATGFILSQLKQKTPDYICAYHLGLTGAKKHRHTKCKEYIKLINKIKYMKVGLK